MYVPSTRHDGWPPLTLRDWYKIICSTEDNWEILSGLANGIRAVFKVVWTWDCGVITACSITFLFNIPCTTVRSPYGFAATPYPYIRGTSDVQ